MSRESNNKAMILLVFLIVAVSINGFLAYRYLDRLNAAREGSTDTASVASVDSASDRESGPATVSELEKTSGPAMVSDPTRTPRREDAPEGSFVQRAGPQNTGRNSTYIDDPRANGDPKTILLAEPSRSGDMGDYAHAIGVWYDSSVRRWAVFNQDIAPMREGSAFDVTVANGSSEGSATAEGYRAIFVHRAAVINIAGNVSYVDHPSINGEPDADLSITPNWNPGGRGGKYNDHPTGTRYDPESGRWTIFNRDLGQMPVGAAFNVAVSDD